MHHFKEVVKTTGSVEFVVVSRSELERYVERNDKRRASEVWIQVCYLLLDRGLDKSQKTRWYL